MTIQILRIQSKSFFITSDNPVVYFVPSEKTSFMHPHKSLVDPNTELYFPLTKKLCILMSRKKMNVLVGLDINNNDKDVIRRINTTIAFNSKDYIFSPYEASFLKKFIKEYIPYPYKLTINGFGQ